MRVLTGIQKAIKGTWQSVLQVYKRCVNGACKVLR